MQTLIIYDLSGFVVFQGQGLPEPNGIPFMWVEVPQGKYVKRVDVSGEVHQAVLADLPITEQQKITQLESEIANMQYALMMEGII